MDAGKVTWERCTRVTGCSGARIGDTGACLAHLSPSELSSTLDSAKREGRLDGRGVSFDQGLLRYLLDELPFGGTIDVNLDFTLATFADDVSFTRIYRGATLFENALFKGRASFEGCYFSYPGREGGPVSFRGAIFEQEARFTKTEFGDSASFTRASFKRAAFFDQTLFKASAHFDQARFRGLASFERARFEGETTFISVIFAKLAKFERVRFEGDYTFHCARFVGQGRFDESAFLGQPRLAFSGTRFRRMASFQRATVERARYFGPMLVLGRLVLDEAAFTEPFKLDVSAKELSCRQTRFPRGAHLRARWADILLDEAELAAPSIVAGHPGFKDGQDQVGTLDERKLAAGAAMPSWRGAAPRVVSIRRADVAHLTLADVDMRACRFWGSHNLDGLRLEGDVPFAKPPRSWRWTGRKVIAEEHDWQARHAKRRGWNPPEVQPSPLVDSPEHLEPHQIAGLYRSLRKGREDNKDEPGAADFYYGEMEMRRKARAARDPMTRRRRTSRGEHAVLTLYWLVSGYGLRSGRALASLLVTSVAFALLFYLWGFASAKPFIEALLFSVSSTMGLLKPTAQQTTLTYAGRFLQLALNLIGPLLFGLMVLSLRGRVKR